MGWMAHACKADGGASRAGNGTLFAFFPSFSFRLAALFAHCESFFFLLAYPRASVRPSARWLAAFNHLPICPPVRGHGGAGAGGDRGCDVGRACVDVRFRVAAMPVERWRCASLARLTWSV
jgi:hypothetical protein